MALPVLATLATQIASGVPEPYYFEGDLASSFEARASEVLFTPSHSILNLLHVPVFAALTVLWWWSLEAWSQAPARALRAALAVALVFAVGNEASQILVPTRMATLPDVGLNIAGVTLGALAIRHARASRTAA